jgi:translation initiation factor 2B subunit (eIF-2B alpha/beta/delta family)
MLTEQFYRDLESIKSDTVHGAVHITLELIKAVRNEIVRSEKRFKDLKGAIREIKIIHPEMASVQFLIKSLKDIRQSRPKTNKEILDLIDVIADRIKIKENITSKNLMEIITKYSAMMTLSFSTTFLNACAMIPEDRRNKTIYVMESRSKREGILLAKKLADLGYNVKLIVDAGAAYYAREVEAFIIGADTIFMNGTIINKIGSLQLALVAKYNKKPFYVAASTNKISTVDPIVEEEYIEEKPADDIYKSNQPNLISKNIYYEFLTADLITKIISDEDLKFFIKN